MRNKNQTSAVDYAMSAANTQQRVAAIVEFCFGCQLA
jgi:hypothetical protein